MSAWFYVWFALAVIAVVGVSYGVGYAMGYAYGCVNTIAIVKAHAEAAKKKPAPKATPV